MNWVYFGLHKLLILPLEPLLIYVCYVDDVSIKEARAVSQFVAQHIKEHDARFLVNATELGDIRLDSRHQLAFAGCELGAGRGRVLDIVIVGANIWQKVVLSQILTMAALPGESHGQVQFFDNIEAALDWLGLPASLLDRGCKDHP